MRHLRLSAQGPELRKRCTLAGLSYYWVVSLEAYTLADSGWYRLIIGIIAIHQLVRDDTCLLSSGCASGWLVFSIGMWGPVESRAVASHTPSHHPNPGRGARSDTDISLLVIKDFLIKKKKSIGDVPIRITVYLTVML